MKLLARALLIVGLVLALPGLALVNLSAVLASRVDGW